MATIRPRRRRDGSTGYTATIRIKRLGKIIHQESETFSREALAKDWAKRREVELEAPGAIRKAAAGGMTVAALTEKYIEEFEKLSRWQRSKQAGLKQLKGGALGEKDATALTVEDLVRHIKTRRAEGAGPATVGNDLTWLGVVLQTAAAVWDYPVDAGVVVLARHACKKLKLIAKSRRRDRLPTYEELERLDAHLADRELRDRSEYPMRHIMWFAIYSARRQAEISRLRWADNSEEDKTGLVTDAKHPESKEGNHRRFAYPDPAWRIVKLQPQDGEYLFPYNAKSIGTYFRRACGMLGIKDLHFHDLRHEATTRLFEQGLGIPQVAAVTLHESWNELKRYTHLKRRTRVFEAPFLEAGISPAKRRS